MKYSLLAVFCILIFCFSSCVTTKVFNDLEARYSLVKSERNVFEKSLDSLQDSWDFLSNDLSEITSAYGRSRDSITNALNELKQWKENYILLKENSEDKIQNSIEENNTLLKEIALRKIELQLRSERVDQLEEMIQSQKQFLDELKQRLSDALLNFEDKGLTVEQRSGKVYVSMENKLLFKSGRWDIEPQGEQALNELASVLAENPDIVKLPSDIPIDSLMWEELNSPSQTWIRKWFISYTKETLGRVRGKFSGNLKTPDSELQLEYDS